MAQQAEFVVRALRKFRDRSIKDLTLEITANLVETTPVDTGWARANWVPSIGTPFEGTAGTRVQAEAGSIDDSPREAGLSNVVLTYTIDKGRVFISNNVPYITKLNEGSSRKAPAAFVQTAIGKAISKVSSIREV